MRKWLSGSAIVTVTAVGTYLVIPSPERAGPPALVEAPSTAPSPGPAEPAMLADVVDVTDINPLLDPPPIPLADPVERGPVLTAVGVEPTARHPVQPASAVTPIPRAIDE